MCWITILFGRAIGLLLVGTLLDAKFALRITSQPLDFVIAVFDIDPLIVLFHPGVDVFHIKRDDLAQARDLLLQIMDGGLEKRLQEAMIEMVLLVAQPPIAGNGARDIEAIGLAEIEVGTKAQFEHQEGMIQQVGAAARRAQQMFVDADERGFEVGTLGMAGTAWAARLGWIIKEGEVGMVALHDGISSAHALQGGLVKWRQSALM